MKKIVLLLSGIFVLQANAQVTPGFKWANSMGGPSSDRGAAVTVDGSGHVYTGGWFGGVADFDPGPGTSTVSSAGSENAFLTRVDRNGNFMWARNVAASNILALASALCTDSIGNSYIAGSFEGTTDFDPGPGTLTVTANGYSAVFVSKFDSLGNFVWVKFIDGVSTSGSSIVANAIGLDGMGNVYLAGEYQDTVDFDPGPGSYTMNASGGNDAGYVLKLTTGGNFVWARQFADSVNGCEVYGMRIDSAGTVYTTGWFNGQIDFDPGPATYFMTPIGGIDVFISKLSSAGDLVWARQLGGTGSDVGQSIDIDRAGNIYAAGSFTNTADFDPGPGTYYLTSAGGMDAYVMKLDSGGRFIWADAVGGSNPQWTTAMAADTAGSTYLVGYFSGSNQDFDPGPGTFTLSTGGGNAVNVFIIKLDSAGKFVWGGALTGNGSNNIEGLGVAVDLPGNIYMTGQYNSTCNFDPFGTYTLTANTVQSDIFTEKLSQCYTPAPPINTTPPANQLICAGHQATLSASAAGTIDWYNSAVSGTISYTGNTYVGSNMSIGTYTFYLSASTCTNSMSRTAITLTVDACLGIAQQDLESEISLYPNPSNGLVNVRVPNSLQLLDAEVYTVSGELILKQAVANNRLDLSSLPKGLYLVKLFDSRNRLIAVKKIQRL